MFRYLSQSTAVAQEHINIKQSKKTSETPVKKEIYNDGDSKALEQFFSSSSEVKKQLWTFQVGSSWKGLRVRDTCSVKSQSPGR